MKLQLLLTITIFGAEIAFAGRFDLPKENPQLSIQMPDNWEIGLNGDNVMAHPANNSKVMISVFLVSGARMSKTPCDRDEADQPNLS
jgi:hypothetical protein